MHLQNCVLRVTVLLVRCMHEERYKTTSIQSGQWIRCADSLMNDAVVSALHQVPVKMDLRSYRNVFWLFCSPMDHQNERVAFVWSRPAATAPPAPRLALPHAAPKSARCGSRARPTFNYIFVLQLIVESSDTNLQHVHRPTLRYFD